MMRFVTGFIGAVCLGGASLAQADPPSSGPEPAAATPATQASASPASSASATPSAPASAAASSAPAAPDSQPPPGTGAGAKSTVLVESTPEVDPREKHFLAEGYKPEMHNGEKVFCRREERLGSRLGGQKVCSTVEQLAATEQEARAAYMRGQMQQTNPKGN